MWLHEHNDWLNFTFDASALAAQRTQRMRRQSSIQSRYQRPRQPLLPPMRMLGTDTLSSASSQPKDPEEGLPLKHTVTWC